MPGRVTVCVCERQIRVSPVRAPELRFAARRLQRQRLRTAGWGVSPAPRPGPRYRLRVGPRRGGRAAGCAGHDTTVPSAVEPLADSARAPPSDAFLPLPRILPRQGLAPSGPHPSRISFNGNDFASTGLAAFPTPRRALTLARSSPVPLPKNPGRGTSLGQQPLARVRVRRGSSFPDPASARRTRPCTRPVPSPEVGRGWTPPSGGRVRAPPRPPKRIDTRLLTRPVPL